MMWELFSPNQEVLRTLHEDRAKQLSELIPGTNFRGQPHPRISEFVDREPYAAARSLVRRLSARS